MDSHGQIVRRIDTCFGQLCQELKIVLFSEPWPTFRLTRVDLNLTRTAPRAKIMPTRSPRKEHVMSLNLKGLFGGNRITKELRGLYFDTPLCLFGYPSEG
jgi:hypothetical protein